jgi:hypothetical protein
MESVGTSRWISKHDRVAYQVARPLRWTTCTLHAGRGIGVESIPVLTKALTNSHACARESAARVLGLFGAKAQTPDLERFSEISGRNGIPSQSQELARSG